ncbi:upstream-binding factor 1-like protein 1 isoform X1 [Syngnathus typhle]|uniref:upstream-binding factor 1-like protein 1 isoform X1 n=1 Tax=Syngnathus typhle TaxID=161592 RepID=UPI002A6A2D4B|nr:upstream-binding factor 1-like protein 1 isoform X1 [Syngnathus typhle]
MYFSLGNKVWSSENLSKLVSAMKKNILDSDRMKTFSQGVKSLDWGKVAFPPFSPEDCRDKWRVVAHNMRKFRTLAELLDEAADELSNTPRLVHSKRPKKPGHPSIIFYHENMYKYHEQHPRLTRKMLFKLITDKYKTLTKEEKSPYVAKYQRAFAQYKRKLRDEERKRKGQSLEESTGDPQPPKPPISGYQLFCKEQLRSMEDVTKKSYMVECAKRWRELTDDKKSSFSTRCETMKRDYAQKMTHYRLSRQGPDRHNADTRPSDSEDEDIEDSSSDEEEQYLDYNEEFDDEDVGDICFNVF